jgi:hypothetical protein
MSFLAVAGGTAALFQAQGRFKAQLGYQFATGIAFALLMVVTAIIGNEFAVGVAVCVFYAIAFPFGAYLATQPMRIGVKRILDLFMRPLLGSIVACCVPLLAIQLGESLPLQAPKAILLPARIVDLIQCIVISVAAFSVYILLMARFQTESSMAVMGYVRAFANRVRNIPGAGRTFRYFGLIDI